jgi:hypothetical protein
MKSELRMLPQLQNRPKADLGVYLAKDELEESLPI